MDISVKEFIKEKPMLDLAQAEVRLKLADAVLKLARDKATKEQDTHVVDTMDYDDDQDEFALDWEDDISTGDSGFDVEARAYEIYYAAQEPAEIKKIVSYYVANILKKYFIEMVDEEMFKKVCRFIINRCQQNTIKAIKGFILKQYKLV